jgi:hypothetical protein
VAEVVANFFPKLVELHNYRCGGLAWRMARAGPASHATGRGAARRRRTQPVTHPMTRRPRRRHARSSANSLQQKLYNWNTLNTKIFKRLGFRLTKEDQTQ